MDQILPPELNAFEFEAMRQLAVHPATCHIPSAIQFRLRDIGYAKELRAASFWLMKAYSALLEWPLAKILQASVSLSGSCSAFRA
jgi:hypothetical protein